MNSLDQSNLKGSNMQHTFADNTHIFVGIKKLMPNLNMPAQQLMDYSGASHFRKNQF